MVWTGAFRVFLPTFVPGTRRPNCRYVWNADPYSAQRINCDPVRFPRRAAIRRIGLIEVGFPLRHSSDDEADKNGAAIEHVLTIKQAPAPPIKAAVNRRGQNAVAKAREVEAPLPSLRIVEPQRASFDRAARSSDPKFDEIRPAAKERTNNAGALINRPFGVLPESGLRSTRTFVVQVPISQSKSLCPSPFVTDICVVAGSRLLEQSLVIAQPSAIV